MLARLLGDDAALARIADAPPEEIVRLVDVVGLEDAAAVVSLLTTPQIEAVFDDDLWRASRAKGGGRVERFDVARFGLWLQILLELGAERAAAVVADLYDRDAAVVVHGFASVVGVFSVDEFAVRGRGDDDDGLVDALDEVIASRRSFEVDGFLLVARDDACFDAVVEIVEALGDARLLRRLAALTVGVVEREGLDEALSERQSAARDADAARDDRRAARGYVSADDARAFVAADVDGGRAIARAYLPEFTAPAEPATAALLSSMATPTQATKTALSSLSPALRARREQELAFVGNALVAASGVRAADAAAAVVDVVGRAVAAGADLGVVDVVTVFLRRPR